MTLPRASRKLLVASTVAWLAGVFQVLMYVALGWPQIAMHGGLPELLFIVFGLVRGILLCVAGDMLRKRRKVGGVLAVLVFGSSLIVLPLFAGGILSVGTAITVGALILVLVAWRELV